MKKLLCFLCAAVMILFSVSAMAVEGFRIVVKNGDPSGNKIAVTVDDCYNMLMFDGMLEICEQYHIPMTFFVVGSGIKDEYRDHYLRALEDGCEIGNHTFSHDALTKHDGFYIHNQLRLTQEALDRALGFHYPMQVMRPPFGKYLKSNGGTIITPVTEMGYRHIVLWNVSQTNPDIAINQASSGAVMLYHTNPADVKCLQKLVPQLLEKGYEFVTVSDMFGLDPVATSTDIPAQGA